MINQLSAIVASLSRIQVMGTCVGFPAKQSRNEGFTLLRWKNQLNVASLT
jgi:hypothetical protein